MKHIRRKTLPFAGLTFAAWLAATTSLAGAAGTTSGKASSSTAPKSTASKPVERFAGEPRGVEGRDQKVEPPGLDVRQAGA